jgi:hypothetical protein
MAGGFPHSPDRERPPTIEGVAPRSFPRQRSGYRRAGRGPDAWPWSVRDWSRHLQRSNPGRPLWEKSAPPSPSGNRKAHAAAASEWCSSFPAFPSAIAEFAAGTRPVGRWPQAKERITGPTTAALPHFKADIPDDLFHRELVPYPTDSCNQKCVEKCH